MTVSVYTPPIVQEGPLSSTSSPAFIFGIFFDDGYSDWCEVIPNNSFVCLSLIISDVEHSFTYLLTICMSPLQNFLLISYDQFLTGLFVFMILS